MLNSTNYAHNLVLSLRIAIFTTVFLCGSKLNAQKNPTITGTLIDITSQRPVPYATVALYKLENDTLRLISGCVSNENGVYCIDLIESGIYKLKLTSMGYCTATKHFNFQNLSAIDVGVTYLADSVLWIPSAEVMADAVKGKSEPNKTIYNITKKMVDASASAQDLLRHIPEIGVDLKQNISIAGNTNILIMVDGQQCDRSYISQLDPSAIDKVELINNPTSRLDGDVAAAINIISKNKTANGLEARFFAELPTASAIVYSFPSYNLSYSKGKLNLFTAYNGEINFENIAESNSLQITQAGKTLRVISIEQVRQKNLSHKFHFGVDYALNPTNTLSLYGYCNPYTYEQDGKVVTQVDGINTASMEAKRDENDKNLAFFNSLYFKHLFKKPGNELIIDLSNSFFHANNSVVYTYANPYAQHSYKNTSCPSALSTSLKIELNVAFNKLLSISSGVKLKTQHYYDNVSVAFDYFEQVCALYSMLQLIGSRHDMTIGLRAEGAKLQGQNGVNRTLGVLLPYANYRFKLTGSQSLQLVYRSAVQRPTVFQLNPATYINSAYMVQEGNPLLMPEYSHKISVEYTRQLQFSFMGFKLFCEQNSQVINKLTGLTDSLLLVKKDENLGTIWQWGGQASGSLKIGILSLSPSFRLFQQVLLGSSLAKTQGIANQYRFVVESDLSAILSFKKNWSASCMLRYSSRKYQIQEQMFSDALYLFTVDKTINANLKMGLMCALPFSLHFLYQASEMRSIGFECHYSGNLQLPAVPIMFRIIYQLQRGKIKMVLDREKEELEQKPKRGL